MIREPKQEAHSSNIAGLITDHERNLQRWSLPSFHSPSMVPGADSAPPVTDAATSSQPRTMVSDGKSITSAAAPETFEMHHLLDNLDTKETAIVEFSNEKSKRNP